jgi:hypothetical protein
VALKKLCVIAGMALALGACGSSAGDNVMSPEANALDPAAVNLALGPETTGNEATVDASDLNSTDNSTEQNSTERANNSSEEERP